jgi:hypothetical protein
MSFVLPPIVKQAERLLYEIEVAVRRFPRFHKYQIGADLRAMAMEIAKLTHRAWRDRAHQTEWIARLVWKIDELKIVLQLGTRVRAFASFAQFEMLARLASNLGKQAGGWQKTKHPKGQNPTSRATSKRAQILSARPASIHEAKA